MTKEVASDMEDNTRQSEVVDLCENSGSSVGNNGEGCAQSEKPEARRGEPEAYLGENACDSADNYEVQNMDLEDDGGSGSGASVVNRDDSSNLGSEGQGSEESRAREEGSRAGEVERPCDALEGKSACRAGPSHEVQGTRSEADFVSEDPEENLDNFDPRWEKLRKLSNEKNRVKFMTERWGNLNGADPGVDLTCRNRKKRSNNQGGGAVVTEKTRKRKRVQSCVWHIEKLMEGVKRKYYSDLSALYSTQNTQLCEMYKYHEREMLNLAQWTWMNPWARNQLQSILDRQRQDKQRILMQHRKGFQELEERTAASLAEYERYMEELLTFHRYYAKDDNYSLSEEVCVLLQEIERMYREYEKFYE